MSGKFYTLAAVILAVLATLTGIALASGSEVEYRAVDLSIARIHSGSTYVDVSAATYTSYVTLLTVEPDNNNVLTDCKVVLDLDFGASTNGFAGGYTTETIQFAVARKIQGLWRVDDEVETATVVGDNADSRCVTLDIGMVGPDEDVRVYVKLSAEQTDICVPYLFMYKSGASATFTDVSN